MHDIRGKYSKTLAEKIIMIRYQSQHQMPIEEFQTPFELKLSRKNRWVKLAQAMPWDALVKIYIRTLSKQHGRPAINPRIVIGALIIKHKEVLSDEKTIEAIQENVYEQYFLGLTQYHEEPIFDSSLFVTIRKRIGVEAFDAMVVELMQIANNPLEVSRPEKTNFQEEQTHPSAPESHQNVAESSSISQEQKVVSDSTPSSSDVASSETSRDEAEKNSGILIVDLTVAPADIAYPTDIALLNTSREKTEELIDLLYAAVPKEERMIKPRTYRKKARKEYLSIAKQRKRSAKSIRKSIRKQLNYVGRNIKTIHALLDIVSNRLSYSQMNVFWIIQELYRQQKEMYDLKTHRVDDRIVSVEQAHVRPIVRGKAAASVEFGAQVSASIMNGYRRIERIAWDPYNEASDLKNQIECYKKTYGCYPEIVLGDKKYGTKENRALMKEHNIQYGGTPLGRKRKDGAQEKVLSKTIVNQRNSIEGTFGTGKRFYGLDCIKARRSDTSVSWIAAIFFVMNLPLFLKELGSSFLSFFESAIIWLVNKIFRLRMSLFDDQYGHLRLFQ
jgi:hypothetical protein